MPQQDDFSDAERFRFLLENAFALNYLKMDGIGSFRFSGNARLGMHPARDVRSAIDAWMDSRAISAKEMAPAESIGVF